MKSVPLSELDRIILRRAADLDATRRSTSVALGFGGAMAIGLVLARVYDSYAVLFWLALVYVLITTLDKTLHGFAVLAYKRLIRKLVRRVQALEEEPDGDGPDHARSAG